MSFEEKGGHPFSARSDGSDDVNKLRLRFRKVKLKKLMVGV